MNDLFNNTIYLNSSDNKYRYALGTRGKNTLYCFGVNPSTATPEKYDPTITRVQQVALRKGFDSFVMLNLYPLRATNPNELPDIPDNNFISNNQDVIFHLPIARGSTVWAAWGNLVNSRDWLVSCRDSIISGLKYLNLSWVKMGDLTKTGNPRHPLYLKY